MTCLGLSPSADTRAERRRHGSMTTAGNAQARRALLEGAWAEREPAKGRRHLPRRRQQPPTVIQDLRWHAQVRRCQRARRLLSRGQHPHVGTGAMARELVGCRWAMAPQVPVTASGHRTNRLCTLNSAGLPRGLGQDAAPVWCHPRRREEAGRGHSRLDRGRHPTAASTVVANPRRAAGSPVGSDWRRLCRCTEDNNIMQTYKSCSPLLTWEVIATPDMSCCRKRERGTSGRWRQSAPCP
jgi:hypothetical protein